MKSDERLFWIALVLAMVVSQVVSGLGGLHRFLPHFFDAPADVCALQPLRPHDWQQWWPRELAETTNPASAVEVAHA